MTTITINGREHRIGESWNYGTQRTEYYAIGVGAFDVMYRPSVAELQASYAIGEAIVGYAPRDGGYLLCADCHDDINAYEPQDGSNPQDCGCGAVFLDTETDSIECCDRCRSIIETTVLNPA